MLTNFALSTFASLLFSSSIMVYARIIPKELVVPHVLYPTAGTEWFAGETHVVTWDTSTLPPGYDQTGMILLGYLDSGDLNEHLDIDHPLARGFPLNVGHTEITVPSVTPRSSYIVVLFGDSGDRSGQFSISVSPSSASEATSSGVATDAVVVTVPDNTTFAAAFASTTASGSDASTDDSMPMTTAPADVPSWTNVVPTDASSTDLPATNGLPTLPAIPATSITASPISTTAPNGTSTTTMLSISAGTIAQMSSTEQPSASTGKPTQTKEVNAGSRSKVSSGMWSLAVVVIGAVML